MSTNRSRTFLLSSAVLWLAGIVFLFVAVTGRAQGGATHFSLWGRRHDVVIALACLLIASAAWGMRNVFATKGSSVGNGIAWLATISGVATALCLALVFLTGASDMLYMLPQGGIGLWLIAVCARSTTGFSHPVRVLGFVAGLGLVLIAASFVMIALALGPAPVSLVDARSIPVNPADVASPLNAWGHQVLNVGSLLGLPTYPLWAWLASRALR